MMVMLAAVVTQPLLVLGQSEPTIPITELPTPKAKVPVGAFYFEEAVADTTSRLDYTFTGAPVRSSSEFAIFSGRPMGLMYSLVQSMPSTL